MVKKNSHFSINKYTLRTYVHIFTLVNKNVTFPMSNFPICMHASTVSFIKWSMSTFYHNNYDPINLPELKCAITYLQ